MRQAQVMVARILQIRFGVLGEVGTELSELVADVVVANHHRCAEIW